jgi:naphthalene 1,2-dioxygenase system ferredoxin subunit
MSDLQWHDVMAEDELPQDDVWAVEVEGRDIAIYGVNGQPYASDNLCSHGNARLCDGYVDGHLVECPFHQAMFDLHDGSVTCGPATEPVRSWPVKIEGGRVLLDLGD